MGAFLNEIDANLRTGIIVFIVVAAPTFGYFYNKLMDSLKGEHEHTSLYVAIGVFITLTFGGLLSWKASILLLSIFALTGLPMIVGEFMRTERKRKSAPRRKRLPYAANGRIDDALMATIVAQEKLLQASTTENLHDIQKYQRDAALQLTTIASKLHEVKQIQLEK